MRLGNRLVYSGYTIKGVDFADDFGVFETSLYTREPLDFELLVREVDGGVFGVNFLFRVAPDLSI